MKHLTGMSAADAAMFRKKLADGKPHTIGVHVTGKATTVCVDGKRITKKPRQPIAFVEQTITRGKGYVLLQLPIRVVSGDNARIHWGQRSRQTKQKRQGIGLLLNGHGLRLPVLARMVRLAPRKLDGHDGLRSAMKVVADAVADAFGVRDDNVWISFDYDQKPSKAYGITIMISEVHED